ncbi:MAG TPA: exopolysaccharide biosynthesis polyprenyl glycosylphosphotransferase [Verrucomicrobiae bacterium]|jgi:putative colanic acid biosynthesis UDP-glucose lipid carrier transferase|nr:exopolysaccharide biosynthesis polyprenyl glycosylphosphotransferase [Verrucomicrobiae bacterium]
MISNRSIGFRSLHLLVLLVFVTLSFWSWLFIWENPAAFDNGSFEKYILYNEFLLVGIVFGFGGMRPVEGPHHQFVNALRRSARQVILGLFAILALVFASQDTFVSRSFLISYVPWLGMMLFFCNYIVPRWLGQWVFSGNREERVALVGSFEQVRGIELWLERKRVLGLKAVGVVCPQSAAPELNRDGYGTGSRFRWLGDFGEMERIIAKEGITQVIVLGLSLGPERLHQLTLLCERAAVRLIALDDVDRYFNHATTIIEDDGLRLISLREEPLENPVNRFVKRTIDLAVAIPVVFFILPFTHLLVWRLQRRQSPGPLLFRQQRIGAMGEKFTMLKYRTMHVKNGDEAKQASKNDSRIFPAGRWLRKLSIDEVPQFINVVLGDMSVVGPRPHLHEHEEMWIRIMSRYVIRRFIRPGITGYAQIKGFRGEVRSDTDVQKRVETDIYYLENWSCSLDVAIILKTVQHCVVPPDTAY